MSVNGSGKDRSTNKPKPDSTTWKLVDPSNPESYKVSKGVSAAEAFEGARRARATGGYLVPVRI